MLRLIASIALLLPACEATRAARAACAGDTQCPAGMVCDLTTGECVEPIDDCIPTESSDGLEVCDGIDNDCDDAIDERPDLAAAGVVGVLCGVSEGMCEHGIRECEGGAIVCAASTGPAEERCDGLDNDCDGIVDNGFVLGAACSSGAGACLSRGTLVCASDGVGTTCSAPERAPDFEECDGIDNDCDGETDEKFGLGQVCQEGRGACETAGVMVCDAGGQGVCNAIPPDPTEEICDAIDNDCDGRVDEDFGVSDACEAGVGQCRAAGVRQCDAGGKAFCQARIGTPREEVCDDLDNDCDGDIDEEFFVGVPCEAGVGACRMAGVMACAEGDVVCTAEAEVASLEVCDGADNDCDGAVDEGFEVGGPCELGEGVCRVLGTFLCDEEGDQVCSALLGEAEVEKCDGEDNDCDGEVDERYPVGEFCHTGRGECRAAGIRVCAGDFGTRCNGRALPPGDEVCDDLDNDCDGVADEDFDLGRGCLSGLGECQTVGERICDGQGAPTCSAVPLQGREERCDELDDDCDGAVDEDYDIGADCVAGDGACEVRGQRICEEGRGACSAVAREPRPDVCDGVDNDCDGVVDESGGDLLGNCSPPRHGTAACGEGGECIYACAEGRRDVDGDFGEEGGNGCEGREWEVLEAGIYFSCGLLTDGTLKCWGANDEDQSVPPEGVFSHLSVGFHHACATQTDAETVCWGRDSQAQSSPPAAVVLTSVAAGSRHTCGLVADGTPRCWGSNDRGQLSPPLGVRFDALSAGNGHSCGVALDGTIRCWGSNASGQTAAPPGAFSAVSAGSDHTCAIRPDGRLQCWGLDRDGQATPPPALNGVEVVEVSTGYRNTCAVVAGGGLVCWGAGDFGQLPAPDGGAWQRIAVGRYHSCAVPEDDLVTCWGANDFGQGDPPEGTFSRIGGGRLHFCALRDDDRIVCWGDDSQGQTAAGGNLFRQLSVGIDRSCGVRTNGRVQCWGGDDLHPQFGAPGGVWSKVYVGGDFLCTLDGDRLPRCRGASGSGQLLAPFTPYDRISLGRAHGCAIGRADGRTRCWGSGSHGQDNPPNIPFVEIAAGSLHTCGLTADGVASCWGYRGSTVGTPVREAFSEISAKFDLTCGLRPDGSTRCWGNARQGQGTLAGGPYVELATGGYNLCAITVAGHVECSPNVVTRGGRSE